MKKEAMNDRKRRRFVRRAVLGALAVGGVANIAAVINQQMAFSRFVKKFRALPESDSRTGKELIEHGVLPENSVLLSEPSEVAAALNRNVDRIVKNPLSRMLEKSLGTPTSVLSLMSGNNAVYIGRENGVPVFAFPKGKISRIMALHEDGHRRADELRGEEGKYLEEYTNSRYGAIGDLFRPGRIRDSKGRLTRYGMENEAWDMAGVPEDNEIRRAALNTYKSKGLLKSISKTTLLGTLLGTGALAYTYHKYPRKWYERLFNIG